MNEPAQFIDGEFCVEVSASFACSRPLAALRCSSSAPAVASRGMSDPPGPDPFIITVGATSFNVRHGRVTTTINEPDTASGTVSADDMARSPTDWRGPAQASVGSDVLSSGQVIEALPKGDGSVALLLRSGVELSESLMPPMVCQNLTPQEIVPARTRRAPPSNAGPRDPTGVVRTLCRRGSVPSGAFMLCCPGDVKKFGLIIARPA